MRAITLILIVIWVLALNLVDPSNHAFAGVCDALTTAASYVYIFTTGPPAHSFVMLAMAAVAPAPMPLALSPKAAAQSLSISRAMLYLLVKAGELRLVKIGARSVVLTADLEAYLAKCAAAKPKTAPPITTAPSTATPVPVVGQAPQRSQRSDELADIATS
jgi:excisionase family DNA binding protein